MVDSSQRIFVYEKREIGILMLMALAVTAFAFTLGVHFGKQIAAYKAHEAPEETGSVVTAPDQVPNRQEITEQAKSAEQVVDDSLNHALLDEVSRTGIRLDKTKTIELPKNTKTAHGGATSAPAEEVVTEAKKSVPHESHPKPTSEKHGETVHGAHGEATQANTTTSAQIHSSEHKNSVLHSNHEEIPTVSTSQKSHPALSESQVAAFVLQVGSYASKHEADEKALLFAHGALKSVVTEAEVQGIGKRFRVYVGPFESKDAAQNAGESLKHQKKIESFLVAKRKL